MYKNIWFLFLQDIDVIRSFADNNSKKCTYVNWNCDAVDEATNNTAESPDLFCSANDTSAAAHNQSLVLVSFCI